MTKSVSHGLGMGCGSLIEYPDGSVEYRKSMTFLPAFRVKIADVVGFSVRRATEEDKKQLKASLLERVLVVQGSGTTLAEVAVNHWTPKRVEAWFQSRQNFGAAARTATPAPASASGSVADELVKLAQLLDAGVLTESEFQAQKARILS